tara:strand:- start:5758 stop:6129 length:372 start_codon:yes stop_codon:yes gene_type:complete
MATSENRSRLVGICFPPRKTVPSWIRRGYRNKGLPGKPVKGSLGFIGQKPVNEIGVKFRHIDRRNRTGCGLIGISTKFGLRIFVGKNWNGARIRVRRQIGILRPTAIWQDNTKQRQTRKRSHV